MELKLYEKDGDFFSFSLSFARWPEAINHLDKNFIFIQTDDGGFF